MMPASGNPNLSADTSRPHHTIYYCRCAAALHSSHARDIPVLCRTAVMAFGSKNSTPSFVLTLPMVIGLNEQDLLYKEFKKCGIIYNQLVCITTKMWHQLRKTRKYRELMADIAKAAPDSDEQKALFKQREKMLKEYYNY